MSVEPDKLNLTSGVSYLTDGYIDYCKEVILDRALPDLRDGLKPVNRRILVTLKNKKGKDFFKSARIAGDTLALHPHGDASVYAAMVLMTDKNGSLRFYLIEGSGSFGGVYKTDKPAAARYTEVRLSQLAQEEYFQDMNGINFINNFDSTMSEPEVLPVRFPSVLVNSTSGIAVGFRSNIPSFNFTDVCNLVIEYIDNGKCRTVIAPDFVTGGYYVYNENELTSLMTTGHARLKLRGKLRTQDNKIEVIEVPYGKTIQSLLKQVNNCESDAIKNAYDTDDFDHDTMFTIDCKSKNRVDEAKFILYRDTDFQYSYSADITVISNGQPKQMGVWSVIEEWVKWRREVLKKEFGARLKDAKDRMRESEAFMVLINSDKKMEFLRIIGSEGRQAGEAFITKNFTRKQIPSDLISFVSSRPVNTYHDGGKYSADYAGYKNRIAELEKCLNDIDTVIKTQMLELISKYGNKFPRRTEVTDIDYIVEETDTAEKKFEAAMNEKAYYVLSNNFIKKLPYAFPDDSVQIVEGCSADIIVAIDNRGRIIKFYGDSLEFSSKTDYGTYIPSYGNFKESDDYKVLWIGKVEPKTLTLLYKDGNIGFLNLGELNTSRRTKVLENGISKECAGYLGAVLDDLPPYLAYIDYEGNYGWCETSELTLHGRTSKSRGVRLRNNYLLVKYSKVYNEMELRNSVGSINDYRNRMRKINIQDFYGDLSKFEDFAL